LIPETPHNKKILLKQIKKLKCIKKNKKKSTIGRVMHGSALVLSPESKLYVMIRNNTTPAHVSQNYHASPQSS